MHLFSNSSYCQENNSADWIFIYYMPYDNNLSYLGEDIIRMIKDGITSDKVIAVVQSDFDDTTGMYRYTIAKDKIIKTHIKNEYSARTSSFAQYMSWVDKNFSFKKSAVILLDHGGKLDELCLDEWPNESYLKVDSVRHTLDKFNQSQNKSIDLLFLQVCTKGSIEPLYELRNTAQYTLSSQTVLGAPNYYYTNMLSDISNHPHRNGLDVANLITQYERDDMYNSYTCLNNSKFETFRRKFNTLLSSVQNRIVLSSEPISKSYAGENYWDIVNFLIKIDLDGDKVKSRNELIKFIEKELIVIYKKNPKIKWIDKYSGLSIGSSLEHNKYKSMLFFKEFKFKITEVKKE